MLALLCHMLPGKFPSRCMLLSFLPKRSLCSGQRSSSCAVQNKAAYRCQREQQAAGYLHLCPDAKSIGQSFACGTLSERATEQQLESDYGCKTGLTHNFTFISTPAWTTFRWKTLYSSKKLLWKDTEAYADLLLFILRRTTCKTLF